MLFARDNKNETAPAAPAPAARETKCVAPEVISFFDQETKTVTHVVRDRTSNAVAVIDPVLDIDLKSGRTCTVSADKVIKYIEDNGLKVEWILETHIHADHLTAASYIKSKLGGRTGVGEHIGKVQETWNSIFNYKEGMATDPSIFDHRFKDGEEFSIGNLTGYVLYTPGHTAVDVTYVIGDAVFVGDTLFNPDYGTARTDFPGGDARQLYRSIQKILKLPGDMRVFLAHDYLPAEGRTTYTWETTIAAERENVMIKGLSEDEFVALREAKDKTLKTPQLLYPSLQVNIRAGEKPPAEDNKTSYIKVPLRNQ